MSTPQKVHLGIILGMVACIIVTLLFPSGVYFLLAWCILAGIVYFRLKCEKCGRRIITQPYLGGLGWNWGVCTHCSPRQEK
ncbi:hypothetical protein [Prosthecobacter sp.]|uniref:hypothetical protein n=1 Tax=Prosthecobacter sp. TaxID=1965333 RepID=UPI002486D6B5|nr:hypothetical protein [Prosthecobacter sp.]MDI1310670.1 hypothetical protein [Prosthecobacter sp.]